MTWELKVVGDIECTLDDSGVYTTINRVIVYGRCFHIVRLDLMRQSDKNPIMSWQGTANNVRKAVMAFLFSRWEIGRQCNVSVEHASYIGYELHRAETDPNYVQD